MSSFDSLVSEALSAPFEGWDFTWLEGRTATEPLPWSYAAVVESYARSAQRMLDMGTGGGEVLSGLRRAGVMVGTEAFAPNVAVAARRVRPLGVSVVHDEGSPDNVNREGRRGQLPFRSGSFDLVIDRHEAFRATEVARVLHERGIFVTQQVDAHSVDDFFSALAMRVPDQPDSWLSLAQAQLDGAGLRILRAEVGDEVQRFFDVGAVVYYLKAVAGAATLAELETVIDVGRHEHRLRDLHERLQVAPLRVRQAIPRRGRSRRCLDLWPLLLGTNGPVPQRLSRVALRDRLS